MLIFPWVSAFGLLPGDTAQWRGGLIPLVSVETPSQSHSESLCFTVLHHIKSSWQLVLTPIHSLFLLHRYLKNIFLLIFINKNTLMYIFKVQCGGVHTFSPNTQKTETDFFIAKAPWQRNIFNLYQVNIKMMLIKILAAPLPPTNALRSKRKSGEITETYTAEENQKEIASSIYGGRSSRIGLILLNRSWGMVEGNWIVTQLQLQSRTLYPPASLSSLYFFELEEGGTTDGVWRVEFTDPKPSIRQ